MMAAPIEQGRSFLDSEAQPGQFVALITDRYWRDTLGSRNVIDTPLVIDGQPHSIVGILSPSFAVPFIDAAGLHAALCESRAAAARAAAFGGDLRRAGAWRLARAGARRARHDLQADVPGVSGLAQRLDPRRRDRARMAVRIDASAPADVVCRNRVRPADRVREHRQSHLGPGRSRGRGSCRSAWLLAPRRGTSSAAISPNC